MNKPALTAMVAFGVLLSGCSDNTAKSEASAGGPSPSATPTHLSGDGSSLEPGTYEFSFLLSPDAPNVLIDVPDGFQQADGGDDWYVVSPDGDAFLGLWNVTDVERDACRRTKNDTVTPGPSVDDLAKALAAQKSTKSTAPEPVAVDDHPGLYVELTGPRALKTCDKYPALWREVGERGFYSDSQVDRLWILDADGQRLVVNAGYGPTATSAEIAGLTSMAESLEFVPAT